MIQRFIIKNNHKRLTLLFAGWACDDTPFRSCAPTDSDFLVCYDYRDFSFDDSLLAGYEAYAAFGWSMGVWAGSLVCSRLYREGLFNDHNFHMLTYGGTLFPMHDELGIPVTIFQGTIDGLTPKTLQKFMRRMCGDSDTYKAFMAVTPRRSFEENREELQLMADQFRQMLPDDSHATSVSHLTTAYIGERDAIFPPANMERACLRLNQPFVKVDAAHYSPVILRLINRIWDLKPNFKPETIQP